ncbi:MAG: alpha/beta hydrolase [Alphaproteobacteria bacterium]|nr:alpha/beta hydrolase [Alphaproteobacteria bacterium]
MSAIHPLAAEDLPAGLRARIIENVNGLDMHVLEAGYEEASRPALLLLHGFPELAYSWRKIMGPLAAAGYHVIAPDQRGYGRTTGWDGEYDGDLASFQIPNLVADMEALAAALDRRSFAGVVGHDFGSSVAAYCALMRPDLFQSVTLMSAPFAGPPATAAPPGMEIHDELAALARPRKHYHAYYSTRPANADMRDCPQGVHDFLRAYYHHKSADWPDNKPFPLASWTAGELAKMPTYYIMDRDCTMVETVAVQMPSSDDIAQCDWLPDRELAIYAREYGRTGFQGGLQWYRCGTGGAQNVALSEYAGRKIEIPACFIAGSSDWGVQQRPGAFDAMQDKACANMVARHLINGAGHWVQQEQPEAVTQLLLKFLSETGL